MPVSETQMRHQYTTGHQSSTRFASSFYFLNMNMCGIPDLTCLIFRQRAVSLYEQEINKLTTGHNRFCRLGADECGKDVSSFYYYHHLHIKRFNCNYILMLIEICNICQLVLTYHLLHVSGCNYLKRLAQYLVIYRMKSGNVLLFTQ